MTLRDEHRFLRQGRSISFSFNAENLQAIEGQSIAAALSATGERVLRYDRHGRGRGLFCGMGVCLDCMVSVNGGAATRACLTPVKEGMQVRSQNYLAATVSNAQIATQTIPEKQAGTVDIIILGAGPAGLSAAADLANRGLKVVMLDERSSAGGQFYKQLAASHRFASGRAADKQYTDGAALIARVQESDVTLINGATVWAAEQNTDKSITVLASRDGITQQWCCRRLIIATGAYELPRVFPGWTLPGVITTGAAQGLLRSYRVSAGKRIVIAGNGPLNLQVAAELLGSGIKPLAVVEAAGLFRLKSMAAGLRAFKENPALFSQGISYLARLKSAGVPIICGYHVLTAEGDDQLQAVTVAPMDTQGRVDRQRSKRIAADTLCLGYGFGPNDELPRMLGCQIDDSVRGHEFPLRDGEGRSSIPEVFIIGDSGRFGGAQVAISEGRIAAQAILNDTELSVNGSESVAARRTTLREMHSLSGQRRFQKVLWALFQAASPGLSLAGPDTLLCRCENITLSSIKALIARGVRDLGNLKRLSRAGMGRCQGRYCSKLLVDLLTGATGKRPDFPRYAAQIPIKPLPVNSFLKEMPEWRGYKPLPIELPKTAAPTNKLNKASQSTDVLVIGGGVIGAASALFLARHAIDTLLVEAGHTNSQASGSNAGSLHLQSLSFDFSEQNARELTPPMLTLRLQKQGIVLWRKLEKELQENFHINMTGGLMVAESQREMALLKSKTATEKRLGIETELLDAQEVRKLEPAVSEKIVGAAFCPGEGKMDPLCTTPALVRAALATGAKMMTETRVSSIERRGQAFSVITDKGEIRCRNIINAAGCWSKGIAAMDGIDLPVQSAPQQMIVTEAAEPLVQRLLAHAGRHLTMKQAHNGNLIIGGGWFAGFDSRLQRPRPLSQAVAGNLWVAQRVVPAIARLNFIRTWAAAGVMIDGAPILGETPGHPGFYNAVGANGFTMGAVMGQVNADLIALGRTEIDYQAFTLARF